MQGSLFCIYHCKTLCLFIMYMIILICLGSRAGSKCHFVAKDCYDMEWAKKLITAGKSILASTCTDNCPHMGLGNISNNGMSHSMLLVKNACPLRYEISLYVTGISFLHVYLGTYVCLEQINHPQCFCQKFWLFLQI